MRFCGGPHALDANRLDGLLPCRVRRLAHLSLASCASMFSSRATLYGSVNLDVLPRWPPLTAARPSLRSPSLSPIDPGGPMSDAQLVTGVDFVGLPTKDLDAAVDFYGSTIGLPRSGYIPERNYSD